MPQRLDQRDYVELCAYDKIRLLLIKLTVTVFCKKMNISGQFKLKNSHNVQYIQTLKYIYLIDASFKKRFPDVVYDSDFGLSNLRIFPRTRDLRIKNFILKQCARTQKLSNSIAIDVRIADAVTKRNSCPLSPFTLSCLSVSFVVLR